jgi:hypothetical protein
MRHAQGLARRVGRRGTTLLFLAVLDLVLAGSLIHPQAEAARTASTRFISDIAPLWVWGSLWAVVGAACAVGAFRRHDRWAFAAAMALKVLWGGVYVFGWAIAGLDRGWLGGVVWWAFAAFVYVVSGWPEATTAVNTNTDDDADDGEVP